VAVFLGVLVMLRLAELPPLAWAALLPVAAGLAALCRVGRFPLLVAVGFLWALARAHLAMHGALPPALEGRDLSVLGTVASPVERLEGGARFLFDVEAIPAAGSGPAWAGRVRLTWYGREGSGLSPGQRWELTLRLKRPRGFSNPGSFDFEAWLALNGVKATGYVRDGPGTGAQGPGRGRWVPRLRADLSRRVQQALDGHPQEGIVRGLVVGLTDGVADRQWEVFRQTGTTHLMAISGSHVALVAGLVFVALRWGWAATLYPVVRRGAPSVAAAGAFAAALGYAALAGLSVPTQRAAVMAGAGLLAWVLRARSSPAHALALGVLGVLILDPLSPLAPGFWLSFVAVAVLLAGVARGTRLQALWARWGRPHLAVGVALLPLTLSLFGENPWVGPAANFIAVPWVGLLVVPPALLGALLLYVLPAAGEGLLLAAAWASDRLWWLLELLASPGWVYAGPVAVSPWALAAAAVGVGVLLLPRGFPARWLALVWLAPLLAPPLARPGPGEAWLTVLDVGQGLAVVVETAQRVLLYDAGPRYGPGLDAGRAVVVPFLRRRGWTRVDRLVMSHGDGDHVGGAASVLRAVPVGEVLGSGGNLVAARPCLRGERWSWDGVLFEVLHPGPSGLAGNDGSCVVRVRAGSAGALLAGDLESRGERRLLALEGEALRADVVVVPHHGSRGASTPGFVAAVAARHAVFATGYLNRFRFPAPEVVARYRAAGATVHETARAGAVRVTLGGAGGPRVSHHREENRRFWHTRLDD
jgi:competence protein ComEC